ncbi:hypothetical protein C8035_v006160 [Colletotrichum spinosum]|uniref:Uncharacterized protein n=1 Tax=Colletotrichum spinosum TaxID=1347390 RepID=A0A4R8Q4I8_9PEZI|nr:hypothetical protein C8035_v006160 [Colletotrichum spinosum]
MATLMGLPRELRDEIIRFAVAVPGPPPAPVTIPMFKAPVSYNDRSVPRKIKVEFCSSELRADEATTVYEAISSLPRGHDNWGDLNTYIAVRVTGGCGDPGYRDEKHGLSLALGVKLKVEPSCWRFTPIGMSQVIHTIKMHRLQTVTSPRRRRRR